MTEAQSLLEHIRESHKEYLSEADDLLRALVQANRQPTLAERTFALRECGWDELALKKQIRRMSNVVRLQAIAGTASDREAAQREAQTAAEVLEREGPKLEAKIQELQAKLNGLERDASLSTKRCEQQSEAVDQLQKLVPLFVVERVREDIGLIERAIGDEIRTGGTRKNQLENCLTPSKYRTEDDWLDSLQRGFPEAVIQGATNRMIWRRLSPEWVQVRENIESELAELTARLAELQTEFDQRIAEAEGPLNFYA